MAGEGLDKIPIRAPQEWSAAWFEDFVRDVLARADVRNSIEGTGVSISGQSSEFATLAASADVQALLDASLVVATDSSLDNQRILTGGTGIALTDTGSSLLVETADVPIGRLAVIPELSVIGQPVNTGSDVGRASAIVATENDRLLRRVGDALDFGQLTLDMAPDSLWTYAKIQDADALSVLGRAGNTSGVLDEITAATDHQVLRRSGTSIGFGALNLAETAAVTGRLPFANIAQITGQAVLGVAASGAGNLAAITAGTNDRLLRQTGDMLNFGQLTSGMFPDDVVPDGALSSNVPLKNVNETITGDWTFQGVTVVPEATVTAHEAALSIAGSQLTGTIADARLSSNVPLLDESNAFTGATNAFNGLVVSTIDFKGGVVIRPETAADDFFFRDSSNSNLLTIDSGTGRVNVVNSLEIGGGQGISDSDNVALLDQENVFTQSQSIAAINGVGGIDFSGSAVLRPETLSDNFLFRDASNNDLLTIDGGSGAVDITGSLAWGGGSAIASSDDVSSTSSGSFTGTLSGMSTSTTGTVQWRRTGNRVMLYTTSPITGTSNGTGMILSGIPAALTPDAAQWVVCARVFNDGNGRHIATGWVRTNSTIDFRLHESGTGGIFDTNAFTASGTKGLNDEWAISYELD